MNNQIEFVNEMGIIILQYFMLCFIKGVRVRPESQPPLGTVCIYIIVVFFVINVVPMLVPTARRLIMFLRARKSKTKQFN